MMKDNEQAPQDIRNLLNPMTEPAPATPPQPNAPTIGKVAPPKEGDPPVQRPQNTGAGSEAAKKREGT